MLRLLLILILLPLLTLGDETACSSQVSTKKYCLVTRSTGSTLACEIFSSSSGSSKKNSLWRAQFQPDYCADKYDSFLKTLQSRGWRCDATIKGETDTCSSTPPVVVQQEKKERSPASQTTLSTETVKLPRQNGIWDLELGLDFSNDLLIATSNGDGQFAPEIAFPSLNARFNRKIGKGFRAFVAGRLHYLEYTSNTSDELIDKKQWHSRIQLGTEYAVTQTVRPEISIGLNRHTLVGPLGTNKLVLEGVTVPELGAGVRLGYYDLGFGEIGTRLGAYYLFSKEGNNITAKSGYALRAGLDWQKILFSLPAHFGINLERTLQNTSDANESSWMLGLLMGMSFEGDSV